MEEAVPVSPRQISPWAVGLATSCMHTGDIPAAEGQLPEPGDTELKLRKRAEN